MSAAVRLRPTPPALRLIRNTGTRPFWKSSTGTRRSRVSPVSATQPIFALSSSAAIRLSMLVNCENTKMRRPSSMSSGSMSISRSSLARSLTRAAAGDFNRRGSQHTWRSFNSASRITIWLRAKPLPAISARTFSSIAARTVS